MTTDKGQIRIRSGRMRRDEIGLGAWELSLRAKRKPSVGCTQRGAIVVVNGGEW
jgi:hypothetical protein